METNKIQTIEEFEMDNWGCTVSISELPEIKELYAQFGVKNNEQEAHPLKFNKLKLVEK